MNPAEPSLQVGDFVMLRHGVALPPGWHIEPGTVGRVLFLDDTEPTAVTVQFGHSGRAVRLRRHDLMGFVGTPPMEAPATATLAAGHSLAVGDLVEILAVTERPRGQPAAPRRYGRVLEVEDENGRVAVEVTGRQHPLHLPAKQLRRVDRV
jgi:hypothetical protein